MDKKIFFTGITIFSLFVVIIVSIFWFLRSKQSTIEDQTFPQVMIHFPETTEINAYSPVTFSASVTNVAVGYEAKCTWEFYFENDEGRELHDAGISTVQDDECSLSRDGFYREGELEVVLLVEEISPKSGEAYTETYTSRQYTAN